jgi:hypothetical protein
MRTFYTLETMPWMYPDSTDAYLRLLRAVDRPRFAVHFDPVNLISSPQRCFCNADLIRDFIARLGPHTGPAMQGFRSRPANRFIWMKSAPDRGSRLSRLSIGLSDLTWTCP